jgi:hypothetical protein
MTSSCMYGAVRIGTGAKAERTSSICSCWFARQPAK